MEVILREIWNRRHVQQLSCIAFAIALLSHAFPMLAGTAQEIYPFTSGSQPSALTEGPDGAFYGTTQFSGDKGYGRVFRVTVDGRLSTLASFAITNGMFPETGVTLGRDGAFYGTTASGGLYSKGTVFRVTTNGELSSLVSFSGTDGIAPGRYPRFLTLGNDGALYGTTYFDGTNGQGAAFRLTTNGVFTSIASFSGEDAGLTEGLTLATDGNFYGTAAAAGPSGHGVVYRLTTNGVRTTIAYFDGTNGWQPSARLIQGDDGALYGTTYFGGDSGQGNVFKCTTNGALTLLKSFSLSEGYNPFGILAEIGGVFYGTTQSGGLAPGVGGIFFQMLPDGTTTTLFSFSTTNGIGPADLTVGTDGALYGTTGAGGSSGAGTVYRMTTGGALTTLATFSDNGHDVQAGLARTDDGGFYGATAFGGDFGKGTIFKVQSNGIVNFVMSFDGTNGANPEYALLKGSNGSFYGTTSAGGLNNSGTAFRIKADGTLTTAVSFPAGTLPVGTLAQGPDGFFYGVTTTGGGSGVGTVFRMTTNCALTFVASFNNLNGALPQAGLTLGANGALYGTTGSGGNQNGGTIFKFTTDGSITLLASFNPGGGQGKFPRAPLTLGPDGNFYGTTYLTSSAGGYGTFFRFSLTGGITNLAVFPGSPSPGFPTGPLTLGSDGAFYGSALSGGSGSGTLYRITTNGLYSILVAFNSTTGSGPKSGVLQGPDGRFYGTAENGGKFNGGNVFQASLMGRMNPLVRGGSSGWFIDFEGIAGNTYRVQRATDPTGPWSTLGSRLAGLDGVGHYTDSASPPLSGFYRIVFP